MMENTDTRPTLFRSFLQFSAGPWISAVISFILTPVTTWLIIPAEFGKASMFTLVYSFILQIALLGTDQSFVRAFYEKEEKARRHLLWQCLVVPLGLAVIVFAAILVSRERISLILFGETGYFLPVAILSVTIITGIFDRFAFLVLRMKKRGLAFSSLLAGNTLLVPTYGARGAAFSTGMSYVLFFFLRTWISQQCYRIPYGLKRFYILTGIVSAQAFINTFTGSTKLSIGSSIITLACIAWSYRQEIRIGLFPVILSWSGKDRKEFK